MAILVVLLFVFLAFCFFVLAPIVRWTQKRKIQAGVHSVGLEADMNYQAKLNAKALADELERRGMK
jgi:hypothetical protein